MPWKQADEVAVGDELLIDNKAHRVHATRTTRNGWTALTVSGRVHPLILWPTEIVLVARPMVLR